jgi:hypothetical protein
MLVNDGTNAFVFLCLKLAHELLSKDCLWNSSKIAQLAEDIENFPLEINSYRNVGKHYDVLEAYDVLKRSESLPAHCEFSEELPFSVSTFTEQGKFNLKMAVPKIQNAGGSVALYTRVSHIPFFWTQDGV